MQIATFLMFTDGEAEAAMNRYVALVPDSAIESIERWAAGEGPEGKIKRSTVRIAGTRCMFFDSPVKHAFGFTPAISFFVDCDSKAQLQSIAAELSTAGSFLMPEGSYGFSQWFCWLVDRWGVSWQLSLP